MKAEDQREKWVEVSTRSVAGRDEMGRARWRTDDLLVTVGGEAGGRGEDLEQ